MFYARGFLAAVICVVATGCTESDPCAAAGIMQATSPSCFTTERHAAVVDTVVDGGRGPTFLFDQTITTLNPQYGTRVDADVQMRVRNDHSPFLPVCFDYQLGFTFNATRWTAAGSVRSLRPNETRSLGVVSTNAAPIDAPGASLQISATSHVVGGPGCS